MKRIRFALCTGCGLVVNKGPYFVKRLLRHLNDGQHNHDAMELFDKFGPVEIWGKAQRWVVRYERACECVKVCRMG